jgi:hypothetical protein
VPEKDKKEQNGAFAVMRSEEETLTCQWLGEPYEDSSINIEPLFDYAARFKTVAAAEKALEAAMPRPSSAYIVELKARYARCVTHHLEKDAEL